MNLPERNPPAARRRSISIKSGPLFGAWLGIPDPFLAEVLAAQGFDYLCVDMQHGLIAFERMVEMVRAVASRGAEPIVRVTKNDQAEIMRALDAGARGVVVPLVDSADEAAAAAAAFRYPPRGTRSFGPTRARYALGPSTEALEEAACIVQIETRKGYQNLEAIAATPGIDGIYIGPSDLALSFGANPGHPSCHEAMRDQFETIRKACAARGIYAGIHCLEGGMAARYASSGFDMITVIVDTVHIARTSGIELSLARATNGNAAV
jgi:4-hydroxy-2-oxoheptanedioate aldolase